jgi:hypothetical protein
VGVHYVHATASYLHDISGFLLRTEELKIRGKQICKTLNFEFIYHHPKLMSFEREDPLDYSKMPCSES